MHQAGGDWSRYAAELANRHFSTHSAEPSKANRTVVADQDRLRNPVPVQQVSTATLPSGTDLMRPTQFGGLQQRPTSTSVQLVHTEKVADFNPVSPTAEHPWLTATWRHQSSGDQCGSRLLGRPWGRVYKTARLWRIRPVRGLDCPIRAQVSPPRRIVPVRSCYVLPSARESFALALAIRCRIMPQLIKAAPGPAGLSRATATARVSRFIMPLKTWVVACLTSRHHTGTHQAAPQCR